MRKMMPRLSLLEFLLALTLIALVALAVRGASYELIRETECQKLGGIMIESTCFDREAVIKLVGK